jgi:hypothetical protein
VTSLIEMFPPAQRPALRVFDSAFARYEAETGKRPLEDWYAWEAWALTHGELFGELVLPEDRE